MTATIDTLSVLPVPGGLTYSYAFDSNNNLIEVQYPDNSTRKYHFDDAGFPNHLTGITDENGDRFATFSYDSEGRAISTEHAWTGSGAPQERYVLDYTGSNTRVVTDPVGEPWDYGYQQRLGLFQLISRTSRSDRKGVVQQFDANNNLISKTDEEGRTTAHAYNATNQKISTTVAVGSAQERTTFYEYITPEIDFAHPGYDPGYLSGLIQGSADDL